MTDKSLACYAFLLFLTAVVFGMVLGFATPVEQPDRSFDACRTSPCLTTEVGG